MIDEEMINAAYKKFKDMNPDGTPEEFAKEIGDTVDLILKAEKPEDMI